MKMWDRLIRSEHQRRKTLIKTLEKEKKKKKSDYVFGSLDCDSANTKNRFHAKLQHGLTALFLASALLGTFSSTCLILPQKNRNHLNKIGSMESMDDYSNINNSITYTIR